MLYAEEAVLEEVLVTARKRTESVQKFPSRSTVMTESEVEDAGVTRIKDVTDLIPNFVLRQSYRLGVVNLSARGFATPQQGDSPIVENFDGVQAPAQDFINQDLFDIERIEVSRGPREPSTVRVPSRAPSTSSPSNPPTISRRSPGFGSATAMPGAWSAAYPVPSSKIVSTTA